jgi:two-component system, NtrC family, response regulator HydG
MDGTVLVIDDEKDGCEALTEALEARGLTVRALTSAPKALDLLAHEPFDVVMTDVVMPELDGLEVCARVAGIQPNVPVIVVTAQNKLDTAIGAMRAGAYDFVTKPVDLKLLDLVVARALQHRRLSEEVKRLRAAVDATSLPQGMVGSSAALTKVHETIVRIADSDATVLVDGETGTGKELIARRIHETSGRKKGPFVSINCAAVPQNLLESELFGHARGAFTDAKTARAGLFVQANGGTLFLDEVGEMPLDMQAKLLRSLQERKVRPVGSNEELSFDSRIIAATNRDLEEEVYQKRFREDLYYRINVVRISLPSLRERAGDVLLLAQHFLAQQATRNKLPPLGLSPQAAEKLMLYRWPGNVRELENCIECAVAFARYDQIMVDDLPERIRAYKADKFAVEANDLSEVVTLDKLERTYIERVLALLGGNKSRAAQVLGIDRRTLYRRTERWNAEQGSTNGPGAEPATDTAVGAEGS